MDTDLQSRSPGAVVHRRPVILNQLGSEFDDALRAHWSQPLMLRSPEGKSAWDMPDGVDVLLTRPGGGWTGAPPGKPASWPGDLRWIQSASTGIDAYPGWFATSDGPRVSCGRGIMAGPIADYVLAAILGFEKRLDRIAIHAPEDFRQLELGTLEGKVIGLFGYGAIGQAVAKRAAPFGAKVVAVRRTVSSAQEDGVRFVSDLEQLAAQADHLVLAAPLTNETRHAVNARVFAAAKPGLHLINVARGGLIDQDALLAALQASGIAGATLDVTDPEPLPANHPLYRQPNVTITPHVAWSGAGNTARLLNRVIDNLDAYARGLPPSDIVDPVKRY